MNLSFKLDPYPLEDMIDSFYFLDVVEKALDCIKSAEFSFMNMRSVCEFLDCYDEGLLGDALDVYEMHHELYQKGLEFVIKGFKRLSVVSQNRLIAGSRAAETLNNLYSTPIFKSKPALSEPEFSEKRPDWDYLEGLTEVDLATILN